MEASSAVSSTSIPDLARVRYFDIVFNITSFAIFGFFGVIFNTFILVVIGKHKVLQTSCFLLICGECVFSLFYSSGTVVQSIQETATVTGTMNATQHAVTCFVSMALFTVMGVQGSNLITVCVAMDRLISILTPTYYRNMGRRHVKVCWIFSFTYASVSAMAGVLDTLSQSGPTGTVQCTNPFSAVSRAYLAYHAVFNLTISGFCVFLYSAILIAFKWRKKTITDPTAAQVFLKQQRASMPTVKLLMTIYGITSVLPEIFISIVAWSEFAHVFTARVAFYIGPIKAASPFAQIIGLYFGSGQFRKCTKTVMGGNNPEPVQTTTVAQSGPGVRREIHRMGQDIGNGLAGVSVN